MISADNGEMPCTYLNLHAVILSPSYEATNAGLQHGSALQLTPICVAEQESATVSLK